MTDVTRVQYFSLNYSKHFNFDAWRFTKPDSQRLFYHIFDMLLKIQILG